MSEQLVDEFQVRSEDGQEFHVCAYGPPLIPAGHHQNPHKVIPGRLGELRTSDGYNVNANKDGTYTIVQLGVTARKVE